jgi:CIC family chloride channel protein
MVGGSVGSLAHALFPGVTAGPGAYALIGMGTTFAGIVRTPLTSVIMVFELTRDYSIIVPLMISNLVSFFVSHRLQRQPIYDALGRQDGVYLPHSASRAASSRLRVSDCIEEPVSISPDATAGALREQLHGSALQSWPVTLDGRILGLMTRKDLATAPAGLPARDLVGAAYPFIHSDEPLSVALEKLGEHRLDALPVVSRADVSRLLGVVTLGSVLNAYGVGVAAPDSNEAL